MVGWAKAHFAPCPPSNTLLAMVGTLRFAHPTAATPAQKKAEHCRDQSRSFRPLSKLHCLPEKAGLADAEPVRSAQLDPQRPADWLVSLTRNAKAVL